MAISKLSSNVIRVYRNAEDERFYNHLVKKLESTGQRVHIEERSPDHLHIIKTRIYHFMGSTVKLSEEINSSLNTYQVFVYADVYSSKENHAIVRILEDIVQ